MQPYATFYRNHGIRLKAQLTNPPLGAVSDLMLPKDSIVHHLSMDDVALGPEPEDALFKHHDGRVLVEHVAELSGPVGGPRPNRSTPQTQLSRNYHRRFRTMRPLHDFDKSLRDPRTLIVENYAHLNQLWQYMRSVYAGYYKWHNILKTLVETVSLRCENNDRQHFIAMKAPNRLPTRAMLMKAEQGHKAMPKDLVEIFARPEQMFLLELWTWLGESSDQSVFSALKPEHYHKINLVYVESGSWFVVNLGKLLEVFGEEADDSDGSTQMQRYFMRLMISVFELRTAVINETDDTQGEVSTVVTKDPENRVDEQAIDEDLEQLEKLSETIAEKESTQPRQEAPEDSSDALLQRVEEMGENGKLSPSQQKRFIKLVERHRQIPSPYGEGTLDEYRKISPKDLELNPELIKLPKMAGVTDESMLESTLMAFDSQYLSTVFNKDVINAAMAVQNAGVIVTDYEVEEIEDAANHFQQVTMRLTPIDGEPSTVRFRLPVVDKDGVFVANNVKYRLRKQRADKPIRKTTPSKVALTSYYAKAFVERSQKSVVNYPKWLSKQIELKGMDSEDESVTDLKHIKTFVSDQTLPRIYTILSHHFREFTVDGKYQIYVDYTRRLTRFTDAVVLAVETDGFVFVGMSGNDPLVVDQNNTFYLVKNGKREILGRIEDLLGLDASKAPVEIAELQLFSRTIPVGIVLGHRMGLSELMSLLEVVPRRVPVGERLTLTDDEYALRFADESLVFNKDNQKAQLVLAGFNRYHRSIRQYNVDTFDDSEVYVNVMEDSGIRVGSVRELELTMDMFVDPITRDLLVEMNEPTTLAGLLIRSCELLMLDWHPDETDMSAMRIRGYERMAGAVYSELLKGVRRYRSRGVGSAAKVDINPEAVWMNINKDASISQIEESNPIQNLKEKELVTYMGTGGRGTRSMVKHTRAFHKNDLGVISEATVDSSAVGVNAYLSANPQLKSLRGITGQYVSGETPNSAMISTSALLAPAADVDDPKRVNLSTLAL
jgi:hypothetical protein